MESVTAQADKLEQRAKEIESNAHKASLLLLSRLSEYGKELNFWRDTVRKAIYESTKDKNQAEELIAAVSENLKTYSTLGKAEYPVHFDSLRILAGYVNEKTQPRDGSTP